MIGVVVAAGAGVRFGGSSPKQFQDLAGRSVLERSILCLSRHPAVDGVVVVLDRLEIGSEAGRLIGS